jgi:hypothetical protein
VLVLVDLLWVALVPWLLLLLPGVVVAPKQLHLLLEGAAQGQ